ncbi:MAG TPA: potassium-transporting ATPase subunit KdpC [Bacteroidales bacterium]|nr:potassium-transporting ATPase subunit KdpC [Bacteroidales bacterium]
MKTIRTALLLFLVLTVLTGMVYPLVITGVAQLAFPAKANGSILVENRQVIGSALLGQRFDSTAYFSSRPSATEYQSLPSGGSNFAVTSNKLLHQVAVRAKQFGSANGLSDTKSIPSEMLFASASSLDPHISPQAARLQVNRIVVARRLNTVHKKKLLRLIDEQTEKPQFFCLGEERVNVLQLNLQLDKVFK